MISLNVGYEPNFSFSFVNEYQVTIVVNACLDLVHTFEKDEASSVARLCHTPCNVFHVGICKFRLLFPLNYYHIW